MALTVKDLMLGGGDIVYEVPGPPTMTDRKGNPVTFKMRVLPDSETNEIQDRYTHRKMLFDNKGVPYSRGGEVIRDTEVNWDKLMRHLLALSIVEPDMMDSAVRDELNCADITDVVGKVFSKPGELAYMIKVFNALNGSGEMPANEDGNPIVANKVGEAKNS